MATTRVFLLRHAESADPTIFHGAESDVGLSEKGHRQAEIAAAVLAVRKPSVVVSSAMRRAVATAAPLARLAGVPHRLEPDLHERRVGTLSRTPTGLRDGIWPDTLRRWIDGDTDYAPEGAESFEAIRRRVVPVWRRLTDELSGRTFVVVAHGVVNRVLLLSLLPEFTVADWHRLSTHNVGVCELVGESDVWQAVRLNDVPDGAR
jgi:broad specificity phosphatase PhoE